MKEISIEEKAKVYDKAIAMAKECITYIPDEIVNKYILNMFPELKESENEKIRKNIIRVLKGEISYTTAEDNKKYIKWLEKQVSPDMIADAYLKGCNDTEKKWLEKQSEQKPTWSDDDEYQINTILHGLDLKREIYKKERNKVEEERYNTQYNWLKSLKTKCKGVVESTIEHDKVELKFKVGDTMRTLQETSNGIIDVIPDVISFDIKFYHCNNKSIAINYEYPPINRKIKTG